MKKFIIEESFVSYADIEIYAENKDEALASYKEAVSYLDKMSVKGVIHTNNAARKKAQLTRHINAL
mgnify:CR=1 FL=1